MLHASARGDTTDASIGWRASALSDGVPLLITIAAGIICYGLFYNRGLGLSVIGYNIAPAERVMQGEVPYRDFLFNYTPGILWVNAFLMKAFGPTLIATRIGLFAFKLSTLIVLFYIARRLTNAWMALVPVGLTLSWLGYGQVFNVYPDQYLILIALLGLICILKYNETDRRSWIVWCGLATGAVLLFKHNVGVLLVAAGALAFATRELMLSRRVQKSVKVIAIYLGAFSVIAAMFVAYLVSTNSTGAMVNHFLHHAAEYSESRSVSLPSPAAVLPALAILFPVALFGFIALFASRRLFELYLLAILFAGSALLYFEQRTEVPNDVYLASVAYVPPILFLSTFAWMVWQVIANRREPDRWWRRNGTLALTGMFAFALYLEVFPRADYYHLVRVLPPIFLFLIVLMYAKLPTLIQTLAKFERPSKLAAWLLFAIPVAFLFAIGLNNTWAPEFDSGVHFRDNRELKIERGQHIFVEAKQAELTEGLVQLIQENSSPEDYIFSFAQRGSALYFLANRRNPTRFLWWRSVGISSEERNAVMTMISNRLAKLIVVQDIAANKDIQDFISDNYDHIGTVADIAVYGLKKEGGSVANTIVRADHQPPPLNVQTPLADFKGTSAVRRATAPVRNRMNCRW